MFLWPVSSPPPRPSGGPPPFREEVDRRVSAETEGASRPKRPVVDPLGQDVLLAPCDDACPVQAHPVRLSLAHAGEEYAVAGLASLAEADLGEGQDAALVIVVQVHQERRQPVALIGALAAVGMLLVVE